VSLLTRSDQVPRTCYNSTCSSRAFTSGNSCSVTKEHSYAEDDAGVARCDSTNNAPCGKPIKCCMIHPRFLVMPLQEAVTSKGRAAFCKTDNLIASCSCEKLAVGYYTPAEHEQRDCPIGGWVKMQVTWRSDINICSQVPRATVHNE